MTFDIAVPHQSWTGFGQQDSSKHDTSGNLESTCIIGMGPSAACGNPETSTMGTIQAGLMDDENIWPEPYSLHPAEHETHEWDLQPPAGGKYMSEPTEEHQNSEAEPGPSYQHTE